MGGRGQEAPLWRSEADFPHLAAAMRWPPLCPAPCLRHAVFWEPQFFLCLGPGPVRWDQPASTQPWGPGLEEVAAKTTVVVTCGRGPLFAHLGLSLLSDYPTQARGTEPQRGE